MTTRRKRARAAADQPANRLVRQNVWAGVSKGETVEVTETGMRSATWEFVAHVRNVVTGEEWIEVVGGKGGDRAQRSFRPERVFAPGKGGGRSGARSSLAQEPRLPLG
jgi:hypothetical protein